MDDQMTMKIEKKIQNCCTTHHKNFNKTKMVSPIRTKFIVNLLKIGPINLT